MPSSSRIRSPKRYVYSTSPNNSPDTAKQNPASKMHNSSARLIFKFYSRYFSNIVPITAAFLVYLNSLISVRINRPALVAFPFPLLNPRIGSQLTSAVFGRRMFPGRSSDPAAAVTSNLASSIHNSPIVSFLPVLVLSQYPSWNEKLLVHPLLMYTVFRHRPIDALRLPNRFSLLLPSYLPLRFFPICCPPTSIIFAQQSFIILRSSLSRLLFCKYAFLHLSLLVQSALLTNVSTRDCE